MEERYLSCAETAKLLRVDLAKNFPGVKFSVKSNTYSGGASIRVSYRGYNGAGLVYREEPIYNPGMPTSEAVTAIARKYAGAGFDGMVDMQYYVTHYLNAAGEVVGSKSRGSYGSVPAWDDNPSDAVALVSFGAYYVFVEAVYYEYDK
jgi:hypothetical protein